MNDSCEDIILEEPREIYYFIKKWRVIESRVRHLEQMKIMKIL